MGTAVQHAIDMETWFPVEEASNAGNSFMEILEEHSLEDDIESLLNAGLMGKPFAVNPFLQESAFKNFERSVPTPPPDLA